MKMEIIDDVVESVATWNANAGNIPSADPDERSKQLHGQLKLVHEELVELRDAIAVDDDVETIDAVCDINVVAAFAAVLMNVPNASDDELYAYDITDVGVDTLFVSKAMLPTTFKDERIDEIVSGTIYMLEMILTDEDSFIKEWSLRYFEQLYTTLYGIGQYLFLTGQRCYGVDVMTDSMYAVLETNSAKFLTVDVANEKLEETIKSYEGRYSDIVVAETPLGFACYRCDNGNGKILKPYDWVAPDIKSILSSHVD